MKNIKMIILGMLFSLVFTVGGLLIISSIVMKYNINEHLIPAIIIVIYGISVLVGTIIATKGIKRQGVVYGGIVSVGYIFILYTISSIFIRDFSLTKESICMIVTTIILGSVGGIIGVNIK